MNPFLKPTQAPHARPITMKTSKKFIAN